MVEGFGVGGSQERGRWLERALARMVWAAAGAEGKGAGKEGAREGSGVGMVEEEEEEVVVVAAAEGGGCWMGV